MNVRSARTAAGAVRRAVGESKTPTYADLLRVAEVMGLVADEAVPLPWAVSTVTACGRIGLNADLCDKDRLWALAQGIGLGGFGDRSPVLAHGTKRTACGTRRRWAEMFAGFLFWPGDIYDPRLLLSVAPADLAEVVGLSERHAASFQHALCEEMEGFALKGVPHQLVQGLAALLPLAPGLLVF